jgi:hypothetical protein
MAPAYRRLLKWARTIHVYLTLFGLVLILFFAVTGFMLNHEDWFGLNEPRTWDAEGTLSKGLLDPVDRLAVVEALRKHHGATGEVHSFKELDDAVEVEFLRPSGRVVAEVRREDGAVKLEFSATGLAGLLTDLHKGKSAGAAWGLVIDAVCVLLLVVSATGLVLWGSLKSRGKGGLAVTLLGAAAALAVYYLSVP